eukprot:NODE_2330_length_2234_cov_23.840057.p1 GENE.NODE_2330_length_2234_cov_23.840057~~NODE_2330_length_2234_cov_23.840057.p1  ORF type:complete len:677 (+),score=102.47 NODE_2330_length_2234_cov_23.840057:107-2032(+)
MDSAWQGKYASPDRWTKYALGSPRLLIFCAAASRLWGLDFSTNRNIDVGIAALIGLVGGVVNTEALSAGTNITILGFAFCASFIWGRRDVLAIYLLKTMVGDAAASKLDTTAWKLLLVAALSVCGWWVEYENTAFLLTLTSMQALNEAADAFCESYVFFRHRYAYEVSYGLLMAVWPICKGALTQFQHDVIATDLLCCFFYRAGNVLIILLFSRPLSAAREEKDLLADSDVADEYREYMIKVPRRFIPVPEFLTNWDLVDFGYTIVALMQGKYVKIVKDCDAETIRLMFTSSNKGNFLGTNHAQNAWLPILSIESAGGEEWTKLRAALQLVLKQIDWENRLEQVIQRSIGNNKQMLDYAELTRVLVRIFYDLVTDSAFLEEDTHMILTGVEAWKLHLSGKGVGNFRAKERVLECMKTAVSKMPGHPLDENDLFIMSAIMQPLFVSPIINVPDVFSVAERQPRALAEDEARAAISDNAVCEAFLKECLRVAHPFPLVERTVAGELFGSYHIVCRYDAMGANGPGFDLKRWHDPKAASPSSTRSCPFEPMIFGAGPRRCQGSRLALKLMTALLMHCAADLDAFRPSQGHTISGRTNDAGCSAAEEWHKTQVILMILWKTSWICAPLRASVRLLRRKRRYPYVH